MTRVTAGKRSGMYRSRRGIICGVCRGIAEYLDFSVFWTRFIALGLLIVTGFWPIAGAYVLAALVMKPQPSVPIETDEEQEFYNSYVSSRRSALQRLQRLSAKLERRIERMENVVTAPEYDWDRRLHDR